MNFPKITGEIQPVNRRHYDDLVEMYVECVSKVDGVLGVVLFGSVSTPGLSDIDIVVTVPDHGPYPDWDNISLKRLAKGHPAESVVAHDVFVWPEQVARNAESFFYVDQQTILQGAKLGGELPANLRNSLRQLLSMDYLIHRFDSLSQLLCLRQIPIRSVLLFISTLRHTCRLANQLELISKAEADEAISDINELRVAAIQQRCTSSMLNSWPERIVKLLWSTMISLGQQMDLNPSIGTAKQWQPSTKLVFVGSDSEDGVSQWSKLFERQANCWATKYVRVAPIPKIAYSHMLGYFNTNSEASETLAQHFPRISNKLGKSGSNHQSALFEARAVRLDSVINHWEFLRRSGFNASSGKGYLGLAMPAKPGFKNSIYRQLSTCLLYTSPSPRDQRGSRMPSSA